MATAAVVILVFGLAAVVAALMLGAGWLLRRMLPKSHVLGAKLKNSQLRRAGLWVIERTELWALFLLVAFFIGVTLIYS
jgi:hypothetical protein